MCVVCVGGGCCKGRAGQPVGGGGRLDSAWKSAGPGGMGWGGGYTHSPFCRINVRCDIYIKCTVFLESLSKYLYTEL